MIDIGPPPKVWMPPKPAIIRAVEMPKSPAESRGIRSTFPYPTFCPSGGLRVVGISEPAVNQPAVMPAGIAANDVAIFSELTVSAAGNNPPQAKPSDFNTVASYGATDPSFRITISVKKLVGNEAGNNYAAQDNVSDYRLMIVLRAPGAYASITGIGQVGGISATGANPPARTLILSGSPLIAFAIYYYATTAASGTLVDNATGVHAGTSMGAFWEFQAGPPANRTFDLATPAAGASAVACFALRLVP